MKAARLMLFAVSISLSTVAFAQSTPQQAFDQLKTLAGSWEGTFEGKPLHATLRVTSMGNTLMHEMRGDGSADDPITMINMDDGRLLLTHYCDAGNQPRMVGTVSPDGKVVTFDFIDGTNLKTNSMGHMQHVVFTFIDPDHHTELWQFAMADGAKMGGTLDLKRTRPAAASSPLSPSVQPTAAAPAASKSR